MTRRRIKSEDADDGSEFDAEEKRASVSFSQFVDEEAARLFRVWVGHVPSSLCLHEPGIRQLFERFGAIQSVTVYHDALSSGSDGYMFLEFSSQQAARDAVAAVTNALDNNDDTYEGMHATMALVRGKPRFQVDVDIADLLLGRRQSNNTAMTFSQHSFMEQADEDELILQSLSQRTTRRSSQIGRGGSGEKQKSSRKKRKSQDS